MYDYIIVGQGISGSVLAIELENKGKKVFIIDNAESNSSRIAAGIANPIVFKRLTKSWKADICYPMAQQFYSAYDNSMIRCVNITKYINSDDEKRMWIAKSNDPDFLDWIDVIKVGNAFQGIVNQAFVLDTQRFINKVRSQYKNQNVFLEETFLPKHLIINDRSIYYKGVEAKHIVFAQGYMSISNPWFSWLPFKLTKGEILEGKSNINLNSIIKEDVYVVKKHEHKYYIGATYDWNDLSQLVTEQGMQYLLARGKKVLNDVRITDHKAGIRPTVIDRRPLLGTHPKYNRLHVFNGMGTKAVMLAPYLASMLASHFLDKTPINTSCSLLRFVPKYYNT